MKIKVVQLRRLIREEINSVNLVHEAAKRSGRFTRQQMIGKVSKLDGDKILRYVRSTRDSKGNVLNVYEVERAETGKVEEDLVHPSDQTAEWYVDDGPEAEEIRQKERARLAPLRAREALEQRWRDKVESLIKGITKHRVIGVFRGPYVTVRNAEGIIPDLQRALADIAVVERRQGVFGDEAMIKPTPDGKL